MRYVNLFAALLLAGLAGCYKSPEDMMKAWTPPEDEQVAKGYIAQLRQNNFEQIEKDIDPSLKSALTHETLLKMAEFIPPQDPLSVKVIGANVFRSPGLYRSNLSFEYQFPSAWLLINVAVQKKGDVSTIIGFNTYRISDSLENIHKFTFAGKSAFQYSVLALVVLIPLFILCVLVLCIRTKMAKRKWLWIIFIIVGIGSFNMNWTTGQWTAFGIERADGQWRVHPLDFHLFGAGAVRQPYGPWIFSFGLPLGAVLFLVRRKKLVGVASKQSPPPDATAVANAGLPGGEI